ncbi:MAG: metallophosphoesterase family protein [Coriobacteriales bacterium]|nr:metallophosphoesterase family protein [Coriobacteriales bacterium]
MGGKAPIVRFDIVSDTHGLLSEELLKALEGADMIMHAGDCCSTSDYRQLCDIAPVAMCLGNNDWGMSYGPGVERLTQVFRCGLRWQLCHYEERLDLATCDIAICGHSHRPFFRWEPSPGGSSQILIMNPGSPTYPRTAQGPTIGRILVQDGKVLSTEIVELDPYRNANKSADKSTRSRGFSSFFRW